MTKGKYNEIVDKIYFAIRQVEGWTERGDEYVDFLCDIAEIAENEMIEA